MVKRSAYRMAIDRKYDELCNAGRMNTPEVLPPLSSLETTSLGVEKSREVAGPKVR